MRTCTAYGCMKLLVTPSPVKTPILPRRIKGPTTCAKSAPPLFLGRSAYSCLTGHRRGGPQIATRNAWPPRKTKRFESEANGKESIEWHFFRCRDRRHLRSFSLRSQYLFLPFHHSLFSNAALGLRLRANKSKTKERNQIHPASLSTLEAGEGPFPRQLLLERRGL